MKRQHEEAGREIERKRDEEAARRKFARGGGSEGGSVTRR